MKALTFHGKRDVRVDEVPDPSIQDPTDAIVRITSTAICGSDLELATHAGGADTNLELRQTEKVLPKERQRAGELRRASPGPHYRGDLSLRPPAETNVARAPGEGAIPIAA